VISQSAVMAAMMAAHLLSDSFLQSREEARGKSESKTLLYKHVRKNFYVTTAALLLVQIIAEGLPLGLLSVLSYTLSSFVWSFYNSIVHAVIDWNIWRAYKRYATKKIMTRATEIENKPSPLLDIARQDPVGWRKACEDTAREEFQLINDPWFFHTIMIDQFLHYATIAAIVFTMVAHG
jgi:hypothetical protein